MSSDRSTAVALQGEGARAEMLLPPVAGVVDEVTTFSSADSATQLSAEDLEAHLNLAGAYREMELHGGAVRHAALALHYSRERGMRDRALKLLLTAPLLLPGGLAALRARLRLH